MFIFVYALLYAERTELELVCVVDNTERQIRREVRGYLFERGVPCIVSDTEHFDRYLPCELIIATEKYLVKDIKYMASMYGKHTIVHLPEQLPMTVEVASIVNEYFNGFSEMRKSRVTVKDGKIIFCGKELSFTKIEMRILKMFLFSDKRYTAESIAAYCLDNTGAETAIAHIHLINQKAKRQTGLGLIKCKRYEGYKLIEL